MAVKLTKRDVIVVFLTGSSNSAGNQTEPDQVYSETQLPATLPHSFFWNRYTDAANRTGTSLQLGHAFDPITPLLNFQEDGPSQMYFMARAMEEKYFGDDRAAHGSPRGIYFVHMAFSQSNMTKDVSVISASVGFNPYSENVTDTGPWQIFAEGYCRWALKNLEDEIAAGTLDNIYVDGAYFIGNETAASDSTGALASEESRFTLGTGIVDWCREMENFCGLTRATMPFVQVLLPHTIIGAASITSLVEIEDCREQQLLAEDVAENPMTHIDGDRYQMRVDHAHYTTDSVARMGIDLMRAREALGTPPILKTDDVASSVQAIDTDE